MTHQWRNRVAAAVVASALVLGVSAISGDGFDPVAFVVVAFCAASLSWTGVDLAEVTAVRTNGRPQALATGSHRSVDLRTTRLSRRLAEIGQPGYDDERLWADLVALIDDRLLRHHDVDRAAEPDRAAEVLGQRLSSFVEACPPSRQFARRSHLDAVVTDIEEL